MVKLGRARRRIAGGCGLRAAFTPRTPVQARRRVAGSLALSMDVPQPPVKEDQQRTRRDIRAAIVFGIVAATLELALLLYFFR